MIQAVLLYGSRARTDGQTGSDTDLLGIADDGLIQKSYDDAGLSFHVYPMTWMILQAQKGSLFLLHLVRESVPVLDIYRYLDMLDRAFCYKDSYKEDVEIGLRIISAVTNLTEDRFSINMRSRYFWGLRTAFMAAAADRRLPIFASDLLENFSLIQGLAAHIRSRRSASYPDCCSFGLQAIDALRWLCPEVSIDLKTNNIDVLLQYGGVAAATAGEIMYRG